MIKVTDRLSQQRDLDVWQQLEAEKYLSLMNNLSTFIFYINN